MHRLLLFNDHYTEMYTPFEFELSTPLPTVGYSISIQCSHYHMLLLQHATALCDIILKI